MHKEKHVAPTPILIVYNTIKHLCAYNDILCSESAAVSGRFSPQ